MSEPRDDCRAAVRIAVVDLGSNSLRLVVFEQLGGALFPLLNEKVMCALGRGITSTGRLNPRAWLSLWLISAGSWPSPALSASSISQCWRRQPYATRSTGDPLPPRSSANAGFR